MSSTVSTGHLVAVPSRRASCRYSHGKKCRVVVGARILESDEHEFTRVIVSNNDVRAEINKHRAQAFAAKRGLQLLWNFAQDQIPLELLATDPHLAQRKVEFLQRHDRECGDLPGLVPLALGMPMLLSDRIDRFLPMTQPIITKARAQKVTSAPGHLLNRSVSRDDPTHHQLFGNLPDLPHYHQSRNPKSRLFGYLPDLPSDVIACMNPMTLTQPIITKARTQKVTSAPSHVLYLPDLPHHHQSRYQKSRLFGYLPDLPSDVIACMSPVMLNPSPHRRSVSPGDPTCCHQSR